MSEIVGSQGSANFGRDIHAAHRAEVASLKEDPLLTMGEVAQIFRVSPKTVSRWASTGKLHAVRTLGGHKRFRTSEIRTAIGDTKVQ